MGKVTVWYMTEEERQAYIKKHPIVKTKKERPVNLHLINPILNGEGK
jgi:hypothetical protein